MNEVQREGTWDWCVCVCVCVCAQVCMHTNIYGGGSQEPKSSVYTGKLWGGELTGKRHGHE